MVISKTDRGAEIKEYAQKEKPVSVRVTTALLSFIGGFLLSNPFIIGQLSPFPVSLVCALRGLNSALASAGAVIGAFVFFDGTQAVKYVGAAVLGTLIVELCRRYLPVPAVHAASCAAAFLCLLATGTAVNAATGFEVEDFISVVCESLICGIGAYIFAEAYFLFTGGTDASRLTKGDLTVLLSVAFIILGCFDKYRIGGFSPAGVLAAALILLCSGVKGFTGGVIAGICAGTIAGMSGEINFMSACYALSGMLSAAPGRKKFLRFIGYVLPQAIGAVIDGSLTAYMTAAQGLVACLIMLAVPERIFSEMERRANIPESLYVRNENSSELSGRLLAASDALYDIFGCVEGVRKTLAPCDDQSLEKQLRLGWESVCADCGMRSSCPVAAAGPSDETMEKLAFTLSGGGEPDETKFPRGFSEYCRRFDELKIELKARSLGYTADLGSIGKTEQIRALMSDQFRNMADIIGDIASDFGSAEADPEGASRVCACAEEFGLEALGAECSRDPLGRRRARLIISPPSENFNVTALTAAVSSALGVQLDLPSLEKGETSAVLDFRQKPIYTVSVGAFSRPADDGRVCGDYFRSFRDENSRYITVLSDGMGTGKRAAVDSAMAAELFAKLIQSGVGFESALPIINSALLVKSGDESLATLDVNCFDLCTGNAYFMKAGAAATFVRHNGKVAELERASLPLGILSGVEFATASARLGKGDIILMASDGALGDNVEKIKQDLRSWGNGEPDELARFIVNSACERRLGKRRDDMTAIAIYIKKA